MQKKYLVLFLILMTTFPIFTRNNAGGYLKKIHYYSQQNNQEKVLENLNAIKFNELNRNLEREILSELLTLGDNFLSKKQYDLAEAFYKKVLELSPSSWQVYNNLEKLHRERGGSIFDFRLLFKQFVTVFWDFQASFLFFNNLFNALYF
jgi:tetratricopeptide (TPR) repeat protein